MTILIVVATVVCFAAWCAIACRFTSSECVRDETWVYEKRPLSDSVCLVSRVPSQ
jgi:hypothetical protein